MNKYEYACKEWLKSCSCALKDKPEECNECTENFRKYLQGLVAAEAKTETGRFNKLKNQGLCV